MNTDRIKTFGLIFLLALTLLAGSACRSETASQTSPPQPTTTTTDPFRTFVEVRNDCGMCGTDSPFGGWENIDGDAMILNNDNTFFISMAAGGSFGGDWELDGNQLCLLPDTGEDMCFAYEQKVDAMTLDDAIFIRR